jgi:small basic protein
VARNLTLNGTFRGAFDASPRHVGAAVTALASVAVSFLGVQLGTPWTMVRATRWPWAQHLTALFVGGVVLFWIIAALRHRIVPLKDSVVVFRLARKQEPP